MYKANFEKCITRHPIFKTSDLVYLGKRLNIQKTISVDPYREPKPKQNYAYGAKRIMSKTAVVQINEINKNASPNGISIAAKENERLDSRNRVKQDDIGSEGEFEDGPSRNISLASTNELDKDEFVVNKIVGHDVIDG